MCFLLVRACFDLICAVLPCSQLFLFTSTIIEQQNRQNDAAITLLRAFDLEESFGPCVGLTRMQRFDRAGWQSMMMINAMI